MSAEQQAEVKRRSSRAAQEGKSRRRRRSRPVAAATVPESEATAAVTDGVGLSRAEARRIAKAESTRGRSRRGFISNERSEGLRRFVRETMAEIRKVVWPDRETTRNLTILVICLALVLGIVLGSIDFVLYQIFEAF